MYYKQIEGKFGEIEAKRYLKNKGYRILDTNFKCRSGEIDIIAKDRDTIVFIEVKTRTKTEYGEAREAVDKKKLKHIYDTANYYLYINKIAESFTRIDVVEVYLSNRKIQSRVYKAGNIEIKMSKLR